MLPRNVQPAAAAASPAQPQDLYPTLTDFAFSKNVENQLRREGQNPTALRRQFQEAHARGDFYTKKQLAEQFAGLTDQIQGGAAGQSLLDQHRLQSPEEATPTYNSVPTEQAFFGSITNGLADLVEAVPKIAIAGAGLTGGIDQNQWRRANQSVEKTLGGLRTYVSTDWQRGLAEYNDQTGDITLNNDFKAWVGTTGNLISYILPGILTMGSASLATGGARAALRGAATAAERQLAVNTLEGAATMATRATSASAFLQTFPMYQREAMQQGYDPMHATLYALPVAAVNALIETANMGALAKAMGVAPQTARSAIRQASSAEAVDALIRSGSKLTAESLIETAEQAAKGSLDLLRNPTKLKAWVQMTQGLRRGAARVGRGFVEQGLPEGGEEFWQSIVENGAKDIMLNLQSADTSGRFEDPSFGRYAFDSVYGTLLGTLVGTVPGTVFQQKTMEPTLFGYVGANVRNGLARGLSPDELVQPDSPNRLKLFGVLDDKLGRGELTPDDHVGLTQKAARMANLAAEFADVDTYNDNDRYTLFAVSEAREGLAQQAAQIDEAKNTQAQLTAEVARPDATMAEQIKAQMALAAGEKQLGGLVDSPAGPVYQAELDLAARRSAIETVVGDTLKRFATDTESRAGIRTYAQDALRAIAQQYGDTSYTDTFKPTRQLTDPETGTVVLTDPQERLYRPLVQTGGEITSPARVDEAGNYVPAVRNPVEQSYGDPLPSVDEHVRLATGVQAGQPGYETSRYTKPDNSAEGNLLADGVQLVGDLETLGATRSPGKKKALDKSRALAAAYLAAAGPVLATNDRYATPFMEVANRLTPLLADPTAVDPTTAEPMGGDVDLMAEGMPSTMPAIASTPVAATAPAVYASSVDLGDGFSSGNLTADPARGVYEISPIDPDRASYRVRHESAALALSDPYSYLQDGATYPLAGMERAAGLVTTQPGTLVRQGDKWKIERKAELQFTDSNGQLINVVPTSQPSATGSVPAANPVPSDPAAQYVDAVQSTLGLQQRAQAGEQLQDDAQNTEQLAAAALSAGPDERLLEALERERAAAGADLAANEGADGQRPANPGVAGAVSGAIAAKRLKRPKQSIAKTFVPTDFRGAVLQFFAQQGKIRRPDLVRYVGDGSLRGSKGGDMYINYHDNVKLTDPNEIASYYSQKGNDAPRPIDQLAEGIWERTGRNDQPDDLEQQLVDILLSFRPGNTPSQQLRAYTNEGAADEAATRMQADVLASLDPEVAAQWQENPDLLAAETRDVLELVNGYSDEEVEALLKEMRTLGYWDSQAGYDLAPLLDEFDAVYSFVNSGLMSYTPERLALLNRFLSDLAVGHAGVTPIYEAIQQQKPAPAADGGLTNSPAESGAGGSTTVGQTLVALESAVADLENATEAAEQPSAGTDPVITETPADQQEQLADIGLQAATLLQEIDDAIASEAVVDPRTAEATAPFDIELASLQREIDAADRTVARLERENRNRLQTGDLFAGDPAAATQSDLFAGNTTGLEAEAAARQAIDRAKQQREALVERQKAAQANKLRAIEQAVAASTQQTALFGPTGAENGSIVAENGNSVPQNPNIDSLSPQNGTPAPTNSASGSAENLFVSVNPAELTQGFSRRKGLTDSQRRELKRALTDRGAVREEIPDFSGGKSRSQVVQFGDLTFDYTYPQPSVYLNGEPLVAVPGVTQQAYGEPNSWLTEFIPQLLYRYHQLSQPVTSESETIEETQFQLAPETGAPIETTTNVDSSPIIQAISRLAETFGVEATTDPQAYEQALTDSQALERTGGRKPLAFRWQGKVYFSPEANLNSVFHEFGGLWAEAARTKFPDLYAKGVALVRDSGYFAKLRNDSYYRTLPSSELEIEALETAIGDKGEQFKVSGRKSAFRLWLDELFVRIGNAIGWTSSEKLADAKLARWANQVLGLMERSGTDTHQGRSGRTTFSLPEQQAQQQAIERLLASNPDTSKGAARELLGNVLPHQIEDIKRLTGIDVTGYTMSVDRAELNHTANRHQNPAVEQSRGQIALSKADFLQIPTVMADYDAIEYVGKDKLNRDTFKLTRKAEDGTLTVMEAILTGRKLLAFQTMYKKRDEFMPDGPTPTPETTFPFSLNKPAGGANSSDADVPKFQLGTAPDPDASTLEPPAPSANSVLGAEPTTLADLMSVAEKQLRNPPVTNTQLTVQRLKQPAVSRDLWEISPVNYTDADKSYISQIAEQTGFELTSPQKLTYTHPQTHYHLANGQVLTLDQATLANAVESGFGQRSDDTGYVGRLTNFVSDWLKSWTNLITFADLIDDTKGSLKRLIHEPQLEGTRRAGTAKTYLQDRRNTAARLLAPFEEQQIGVQSYDFNPNSGEVVLVEKQMPLLTMMEAIALAETQQGSSPTGGMTHVFDAEPRPNELYEREANGTLSKKLDHGGQFYDAARDRVDTLMLPRAEYNRLLSRFVEGNDAQTGEVEGYEALVSFFNINEVADLLEEENNALKPGEPFERVGERTGGKSPRLIEPAEAGAGIDPALAPGAQEWLAEARDRRDENRARRAENRPRQTFYYPIRVTGGDANARAEAQGRMKLYDKSGRLIARSREAKGIVLGNPLQTMIRYEQEVADLLEYGRLSENVMHLRDAIENKYQGPQKARLVSYLTREYEVLRGYRERMMRVRQDNPGLTSVERGMRRFTNSIFSLNLGLPAKQLGTAASALGQGIIEDQHLRDPQALGLLAKLTAGAYRDAGVGASVRADGSDQGLHGGLMGESDTVERPYIEALLGQGMDDAAKAKQLRRFGAVINRLLDSNQQHVGDVSFEDLGFNSATLSKAQKLLRQYDSFAGERLMSAMRRADRAPILYYVQAAQLQASAEGLEQNSDAWWDRVAHLTERVVSETYNTDSLAERTPMQLSEQFFTRMLGMYSSQQQKQFGLLIRAMIGYTKATPGTPEAKLARERLLKTLGYSVLANAVYVSAVSAGTSVIMAMLAGGEPPETDELIERVGFDGLRNVIGMAPGLGTMFVDYTLSKLDSVGGNEQLYEVPSLAVYQQGIDAVLAAGKYMTEEDERKSAQAGDTFVRKSTDFAAKAIGLPSTAMRVVRGQLLED